MILCAWLPPYPLFVRDCGGVGRCKMISNFVLRRHLTYVVFFLDFPLSSVLFVFFFLLFSCISKGIGKLKCCLLGGVEIQQSRATPTTNIKLICVSDLVEIPVNQRGGGVAVNHCCCFRGEMRSLFPKVSFSAVELFISSVAFLKLLLKEIKKR